jgi:coenzyme F420-0:L-glutamate ligase/coenzyme F420-1:gamma-L-glutamate ligase
MPERAGDLRVIGVRGLPEVRCGADLAGLLRAALRAAGEALRNGDVLVVAQKVVSKSEGREVELATVEPSARARELAGSDGDPAHVELVLREARRIVRRRGSFLVCETHHGFVCASAGVDRSNASGPGRAILLPVDPDASAARLRAALAAEADVAVVVSDSFGRPFRLGTTGVALGCAGLEPLESRVGERDSAGRELHATSIHAADQLASAAELVMGPLGGVPAAIVRGYPWRPGRRRAVEALMPRERDLFA